MTIQNPIALSTCWLSHRHQDGYAMMAEIADLGYEYVELSHGVSASLVIGILKALGEGIIKVSSVHNFCPLPPGVYGAVPNLYEPSSKNRKELELWLRYTQKTIDFAQRVEASVVVAHMGSVPFLWRNPVERLMMLDSGKTLDELKDDRKFQKALKRTITRVRAKAPKYIERVKQSLSAIGPYAEAVGVIIGLENREGLGELPLDGAAGDLMNCAPTAAYWHDSGHAQLKERLGIVAHKALLAENRDRIAGFHLKDVTPQGQDNQQLGTGMVDFSMIRRFILPHHVLVVEVSPRLTPQQVRESREYLEQLIALENAA